MPLLQKEEPQNSHRSATWLELFFDLFFVAVIGNLSHELTKNISLSGVENFAISFIAIWWIWIGITIYNERFETDGIENRLFTFLLMIPVTGLAIFSHNVTEGNLQNFLLSYMIARIIIVLLWLRAGYHNKPFRPTSNIYILGFSASILLVFAGAMLNSKISLTLFLIADYRFSHAIFHPQTASKAAAFHHKAARALWTIHDDCAGHLLWASSLFWDFGVSTSILSQASFPVSSLFCGHSAFVHR